MPREAEYQQRDRSEGFRSETPHREPVATERFDHENKTFFVDGFENHRGKMIRITEKTGGMRSNVQVDLDCIAQLIVALENVRRQME